MSIRILLGRSRWRRRRALTDLELGAPDALGRPTFLLITDTWRKRDQVVADFADRGAFEPPVRVWGELVTDLWNRYGDGRALLTDRAVALTAHRLLIEHPERYPWLHGIGAPAEVARALARLERRLAENRDPHLRDAPRREQLLPMIRDLRRTLGEATGRVRRSEAREVLLERLSSPTPPLMRWLRAHPTVIVDDILQPSPLDIALLLTLSRAWSAAGVHVVLSFETGRDLGGREAALFFGFDGDVLLERGLAPFAATSRLRRAVFDGLVGTGEAELWLAGPDATVEVQPWTEPDAPAPPDLADLLAAGAPVPGSEPSEARGWLADTVRLTRAVDADVEVRHVAASVKQTLHQGARPDDCLVAVADPSLAGPLREALEDVGVPVRLGGGLPLVAMPVCTAALRVASVALDGFPPADVLALADQVGVALPVAPAVLRRWCEAARVPAGPPQTWRPVLDRWLHRTRAPDSARGRMRESIDRLSPWVEPLHALTEDHAPSDWQDALVAALDRLGVSALPGDDPESLHAISALLEAVEALTLDLAATSERPWPAALLRDQFELALLTASFDPTPPSGVRVNVVGLLELRGLTPPHTWLAGLSRGAFPRPRPAPFLVPAEVDRRLEPVDPVAEGRYLLSSLLRNALSEPWMRSLELSWPATRDGRPTPASPLLEELLDLRLERAEDRLGACIVDDAIDPGAWGRAAVQRRAARAPDAWGPLLTDPQRLRRSLEVVDARTGPPGPRDGQLVPPPPAPQTLSVTAMETYLRCPARYWYDHVLRLDVPDGWEPELEPRRRGIVLHRILERFLTERDLQPLAGDDAPETAALLHRVAGEELDHIEAEGGFDPAFQAYARSRWLAGLVDDEPGGLLAAWLQQERSADPPRIPVAVERSFTDLPVGPVQLRGVLDRLDRTAAGALQVTDYKTGVPPTRRQVALGLSLQPVAYAEAVARAHPDTPVASVFLRLAKPDALQHRGWTGDPAALAILAPSGRGVLPLDAAARAEVLDRAAAAAERLVAGRFEPTRVGAADAGCSYCPHARICRVDHARMAALTEEESP